MREISPAQNASVDEFLNHAPAWVRAHVERIRAQKRADSRRHPSASLIDYSGILTPQLRAAILDRVAGLVDENYVGRAEMCLQFADLLNRGLKHLGVGSRPALGTAIYFVDGREIFRWGHAWVRIGGEMIDGNVDSLDENPLVPSEVRVQPYWGPIAGVPSDRRLREDQGRRLGPDEDVEGVWWPELRAWLDKLPG